MEILLGSSTSRIINDHKTEFNNYVVILSILLAIYLLQFSLVI